MSFINITQGFKDNFEKAQINRDLEIDMEEKKQFREEQESGISDRKPLFCPEASMPLIFSDTVIQKWIHWNRHFLKRHLNFAKVALYIDTLDVPYIQRRLKRFGLKSVYVRIYVY